jgi:hypothetical protein
MSEALFKTVPEILSAMRHGPIPKHQHDDELLCFYAERIKEALKPLLSIDLSKVSPLPWKSRAYNIAGPVDWYGVCDVADAEDNSVLGGDGDGPNERIVEIDDFDHDANCVAAAACVNAIAELQAEFAKRKETP